MAQESESLCKNFYRALYAALVQKMVSNVNNRPAVRVTMKSKHRAESSQDQVVSDFFWDKKAKRVFGDKLREQGANLNSRFNRVDSRNINRVFH